MVRQRRIVSVREKLELGRGGKKTSDKSGGDGRRRGTRRSMRAWFWSKDARIITKLGGSARDRPSSRLWWVTRRGQEEERGTDHLVGDRARRLGRGRRLGRVVDASTDIRGGGGVVFVGGDRGVARRRPSRRHRRRRTDSPRQMATVCGRPTRVNSGTGGRRLRSSSQSFFFVRRRRNRPDRHSPVSRHSVHSARLSSPFSRVFFLCALIWCVRTPNRIPPSLPFSSRIALFISIQSSNRAT